MPTRPAIANGSPCWFDLLTRDKATSTAFYTELFGWTVDDPGPDYGGYVNFTKDGVPIAGCMDNGEPDTLGDFWSVYLATDDAAATVARAEAAGAAVFMPTQEVMSLGTMAMLGDKGNGNIGVWQPGDHHGFGLWNEDGAPAWFELHTRAFADDLAYYSEVFGLSTLLVGDTDEFRYAVVLEGDEQVAGIMDATIFPEDAPLGWSVYLGVDDAAAATAKAVSLGATVTIGPDDTPYGVLVGLNDPTGAAFKLRQAPAATTA